MWKILVFILLIFKLGKAQNDTLHVKLMSNNKPILLKDNFHLLILRNTDTIENFTTNKGYVLLKRPLRDYENISIIFHYKSFSVSGSIINTEKYAIQELVFGRNWLVKPKYFTASKSRYSANIFRFIYIPSLSEAVILKKRFLH